MLIEMKMPAARKQMALRLAGQILPINMAATFAAIILGVLSMGWARATSIENIFSCFAHSFFIGSLIGLTVFYTAPRMAGNAALTRWVKMTVIIFFATFVGVTFANALMSLAGYSDWERVFSPRAENLLFSLVIAFLFGFSSFFYEISQTRLAAVREKLRRAEVDEARARSLAAEAQFASLESRIHPHFLFNTLNSIAALIREEPLVAEKMVEKLAALLRYSLDENATSLVSLKQELEISEKYLEIEKARFGERLNYKIETDSKLENVKLPPLALQTLIENSIKHVAAKTSEKTEIRIAARADGTDIVVEVGDDGAGFSSKDLRDGHGLDTLQKRLATVFAGAAKLEIGGDGTVRLKIPKV